MLRCQLSIFLWKFLSQCNVQESSSHCSCPLESVSLPYENGEMILVLTCSLLIHPFSSCPFWQENAKNTAVGVWSFQQIAQLSLHFNVTSCLVFSYLIISWSPSVQFAIYFCQLKRFCVPSIILNKANYELWTLNSKVNLRVCLPPPLLTKFAGWTSRCP